jgi:hypothetical protein
MTAVSRRLATPRAMPVLLSLLMLLLTSGCGAGRDNALALVEVETGPDATIGGTPIRLPEGGTLVTYGEGVDGQPAIRDAQGTLRALRDFIGWSWAAAMIDGRLVTALLTCTSDQPPHRLRLVASPDGGRAWEDRTVAPPAAPASRPEAAAAGGQRQAGPSSHKELRLAITDHDAGGTLQRRTVLFISEDGGRSWYQAPDASDVPTSR